MIAGCLAALVAAVMGLPSIAGTGARPSTTAVGGGVGGRALVLIATAAGPSSATLAWPPVPGATAYRVLRDGRVIDQFPAAGSLAPYADAVLWPSSTYGYVVRALGPGGSVLTSLRATVTTPPLTQPVPRLYGPASFWNTPIGASPTVDPGSAAMVGASISAFAGLGVVNDNDVWGIPVAVAADDTRFRTVACLKYLCQGRVTFRIPSSARPNLGSDGHLAVIDPASGQELDLWQGHYDPATGSWSAGSRTVTSLDWGAACAPGTHCGGGGTAAGFLEAGGVIRPEEILQGHIEHALVLSTPHLRRDALACPGTDPWSSRSPAYADDPDALPLGARVQLDPGFDVSAQAWPAWEKTIARALQVYGAYVADVSGSLELRGEANLTRGYDAWARVGMATSPMPSLANLPWSQFRVLQLQSC